MAIDEVNSFFLEDLQVLSVMSFKSSAEGEGNLHWRASYEKNPADVDAHVVIGLLTYETDRAHASCTVGGQFTPVLRAERSEDELTRAIKTSSALETLYDFARVSLMSALATIGVSEDIPRKSPTPRVEPFGDSYEIDD
jgi:hypothetical protein